MLTFGATAHFIVPELDAGGQIIQQVTFTVAPGTPLEEVVRTGQTVHEPRCLVEGLRRVLHREVELHFHKVVPAARRSEGRPPKKARPAPIVPLLRDTVGTASGTFATGDPVMAP
jgi:hypothetical protein